MLRSKSGVCDRQNLHVLLHGDSLQLCQLWQMHCVSFDLMARQVLLLFLLGGGMSLWTRMVRLAMKQWAKSTMHSLHAQHELNGCAHLKLDRWQTCSQGHTELAMLAQKIDLIFTWLLSGWAEGDLQPTAHYLMKGTTRNCIVGCSYMHLCLSTTNRQ